MKGLLLLSGQKLLVQGARFCGLEVCAHVAQSAEHILGKDEVSGSIPLMGF